MCGFIGIIRKNADFTRRNTEFYKSLLEKRGPDDFRSFISPCNKIELHFYRLSIIDLDNGFQPSTSASGKVTSVFNGEIYNYKELREHLLTKGIPLKTQGDAEVIPNLFELYGERFVEMLRGMFTILVWDGDKTIAYRDRFGIKPLYISENESEFVISSEVKPILKLHGKVKNISQDALDDFLNYGYVLSPHHIFDGVKSVTPGNYLRIEDSIISDLKYWDLNQLEQLDINLESALELVDQKINESIRLHLHADVPVGLFLSGGFDSGIIAAKASKFLPDLKTYSLRFVDKPIDESVQAAELASRYSLTHKIFDVSSADLLTYMTASIWQSESPLADSGMMANMFLSKMVREDGIKVALTGTGGDEIFGGYTYHVKDSVEAKLAPFASVLRKMVDVVPSLYAKKIVRACSFDIDPLRHYLGKTRVFNNFDNSFGPNDLKAHYFQQYIRWPKTARLAADLKTYVPDNLMLLIDRSTMAYSIEGRVPFLDHELVELLLSLPPSIRNANGERKGLLRELGRSYLPETFYTLPKLGFNSPIEEWMKGDLGKQIDGVLRSSKFRQRPFQENLKRRQLKLASMNFHQRWSLFQLELFHRIFVDGDFLNHPPTLEELF